VENTPESRAKLAAAFQGKTAAEIIAEGEKIQNDASAPPSN